MHARSQKTKLKSSQRALDTKNGPEEMSEQISRPASKIPAGARLENQYKPVGIAALNAAVLCKNAGAATKKQK